VPKETPLASIRLSAFDGHLNDRLRALPRSHGVVLAGRKKLIIGPRFGKRQMLFVDPQGIPITPGQPGQVDVGKTTPPEERKQKP
jgi:hypothetical protein